MKTQEYNGSGHKPADINVGYLINAKGLLKDRLKTLIIIFVIYLPFLLLQIGCPLRFSTGITCPGCGMTRAILSAIRLHFDEAFYYHPLFWLSPLMVFLYLFEGYLKKSLVKIAWVSTILAFIITYVIRLFIIQNSVVKIDFTDGIMAKLIHHIIVGGYK